MAMAKQMEEKWSLGLVLVRLLRGKPFIENFYNYLIKPKTNIPEKEWQEISFNIIIIAAIILSAAIGCLYVYENGILSLKQVIGTEIFLLCTLLTSRLGHYRPAMFSFLFSQLLLVSYIAYNWTATDPEVLLGFSLLMTFTGILLGRRATIILSFVIAAYVAVVSDVHNEKDGLLYLIILLIAVLISYLSRSELQRLLKETKAEVHESKKKLKASELEKMSTLYRFAEFGKLSSGLFHDLINPLTAMSLYLDDLAGNPSSTLPLELKRKLETTLAASRRMEEFIFAIRKQLSQESDKKTFSVQEEISQAIELLNHRANKEQITLECNCSEDVYMYGNPMRFYQVIMNLISNAIDAYKGTVNRVRLVKISLHNEYTSTGIHIMKLSVKDYGAGMDRQTMKKAFDPFFSTKDTFAGSGIGLSTTKGIIEKDFSGHINVKSSPGEGTIFTVTLPIIEYS